MGVLASYCTVTYSKYAGQYSLGHLYSPTQISKTKANFGNLKKPSDLARKVMAKSALKRWSCQPTFSQNQKYLISVRHSYSPTPDKSENYRF
jgi:hypothetical protein